MLSIEGCAAVYCQRPVILQLLSIRVTSVESVGLTVMWCYSCHVPDRTACTPIRCFLALMRSIVQRTPRCHARRCAAVVLFSAGILASGSHIDHIVVKYEPMTMTLHNRNVVAAIECTAAVYHDRY